PQADRVAIDRAGQDLAVGGDAHAIQVYVAGELVLANELSGSRLPESDGAARLPGNEMPAVRRKNALPGFQWGPPGLPELLSGGHLPDAEESSGPGTDQPAIGGEGAGRHCELFPSFKPADFFARRQGTQADRPKADGDQFSVTRKDKVYVVVPEADRT